MGRGRGCVFGSSPKRLEQLHLELVHWWLLVHSGHTYLIFIQNGECRFNTYI